MLGTASPKPLKGTAKRLKARAKRQESKHAKGVRARCVERDGYCAMSMAGRWSMSLDRRLVVDVFCSGPSEWAHIGQHRRCHTRGQAPEQRHTTQWSAMLCKRHHDAYDAHEFDIEPLNAEAGMDGFFTVRVSRRAA